MPFFQGILNRGKSCNFSTQFHRNFCRYRIQRNPLYFRLTQNENLRAEMKAVTDVVTTVCQLEVLMTILENFQRQIYAIV